MLKTFCFIISSLFFLNFSYAALDLRILHTRTECNHDGHTSAWCTLEDSRAAEERAGMVKEINRMLDLADSPDSKIYIGYFSFSNKGVFKKLCEKGKEGISIEGFFDYDYSKEDQLPLRLENECQGENGDNIKVRFLGEKVFKTDPETGEYILNPETGERIVDVWRLHHNKFLIVDPGKGNDLSISFSSGNLSAFGTSLHFDHWVTTVAPYNSQFSKSHKCVVEGLRTAVDDSEAAKDDPDLYKQAFDLCFEQLNLSYETGLEEDGIYLLNSPNDDGRTEDALIAEIENLGEIARENTNSKYAIYAAMQNFTHDGIARALNKLCRNKQGRVEVNMIMDDDVVLGSSEVPGTSKFFNAYLKNRENGGKSCININFMETNSAVKQMMHNKFIVFTGPNYARSFSGAGHFTYSGMTHNYENFYVSNGESLVRSEEHTS